MTALAADDILEALNQARTAYQSGNLGGAKQSLDHASQLIGQKNAEGFATMLPEPLAGWTAEKARVSSLGQLDFGASVASRDYTNGRGDNVEVQITGDSAMVTQFAALFDDPQIAGAMGKIVHVGSERAIQTQDGDVNVLVVNKFLVTVHGSASPGEKLAYAQAVDVAKLSKM